jgi:hypothetical protein
VKASDTPTPKSQGSIQEGTSGSMEESKTEGFDKGKFTRKWSRRSFLQAGATVITATGLAIARNVAFW